MQRAAELALQFSHAKPNGEICLEGYGIFSSAAENIACGQKNALEVHTAWLEEDEPYEGQGHRRNLLFDDLEAVGVGCVEYEDRLFWVESFRAPVGSVEQTTALDEEKTVSIEVDPGQVKVFDLRVSSDQEEMSFGTSKMLPSAALCLQLKEGVSDVILPLSVQWKSSDPSVAEVSEQKLIAHKGGTCVLTASTVGCTLEVPVTVSEIVEEEPTQPPEQVTEPTTPVPAHTHTPEVLPPVTATCMTTGLTAGSKCKDCGEILVKQNVIPKTAHSFTTKLTKAMYHKAGKSVRVCSVCGFRETEVIPAVASIKLSATSYVFNEKRHTPKVRVSDENGKQLQRDVDYTLTYPKGRKNVGTYQIQIKFIGNYKGSKTVSYKVVPAKVSKVSAKAGVKKASLSWKPALGATDYIVYYSLTQKGGYQMLGTTKKTSASMVRLDSGKTYYFRVRAVTITEDGQWNGAISPAVKVVAK